MNARKIEKEATKFLTSCKSGDAWLPLTKDSSFVGEMILSIGKQSIVSVEVSQLHSGESVSVSLCDPCGRREEIRVEASMWDCEWGIRVEESVRKLRVILCRRHDGSSDFEGSLLSLGLCLAILKKWGIKTRPLLLEKNDGCGPADQRT